jgi:hypothetical protein
VWSEGLCQSGIEPATFPLVAQCLKHASPEAPVELMVLTLFGFMRDEVRVRPGKYRNEDVEDMVTADMSRPCNAY